MSFNQSKAEKSEGQLRRTGRSGSFGQHRGFSGGGKGGVPAPPPHSSSSNPASLSSNRSFKKSGNVQGGPVAGAAVSSNVVNQTIQNGLNRFDLCGFYGFSIMLFSGNASKQFTLQFGTINPGIINGMRVCLHTQCASNFQRGIPKTPMQVMHKASKKYEIGKVSVEEEAKQRQLKAILNKLTPRNFEKLFAQIKEVNIDNSVTLKGVITQIFDKALMKPTFCEMYASFCFHLATDLPDFIEDNEKVTFKRLLLNKCQEEFERGEREQAEADKAAEEGEIEQSEGEREEKRIKARRRMLGNIRLIGELYKKKMLTERLMHECIKKLLGEYQNPDEEDFEALCKLMSTIGDMIDHPKAKEHMDAYFDLMLKLSTNQKLSSRVRFMLKDAIDLRKNKWQQRRKVEGPKKIEEVNRAMKLHPGQLINLIDISSDEDEDEVDDDLGNHFSNSTCLDVEVKRKEIRVDEDCYILEYDPFQSVTVDFGHKLALNNDQEQDIIIVAEKGQVACRDYPHSRHLCAQYPFNTTPHEYSCPQCYCYICVEPAPCRIWHGDLGHCHASDQDRTWVDLRATFRTRLR